MKKNFGKKENKRIRRNDFMLIIILLFLAVVVFFVVKAKKTPGSLVVVSIDGEEILQLPLAENHIEIIENQADYNILVIENKLVNIKEANCANQLCVKHKSISLQGEMIVCAPHKLVVQIIGDSEIDSVNY